MCGSGFGFIMAEGVLFDDEGYVMLTASSRDRIE